ncbi:hypothetical protein [Labrys sp. WJW]|uniref:hypothetical protein n=1 Tax=Labrys sp. WJW TaxID=1737983 RepID=UPI0012EAC655|nr:hypothetical protein [Labrys sp. WJW]
MHMFFVPAEGGNQYCVEDWGWRPDPGQTDAKPNREEPYQTIAACDGIMMARAAFKEAVKERPRNLILLRQGMRVILDSQRLEDGSI